MPVLFGHTRFVAPDSAPTGDACGSPAARTAALPRSGQARAAGRHQRTLLQSLSEPGGHVAGDLQRAGQTLDRSRQAPLRCCCRSASGHPRLGSGGVLRPLSPAPEPADPRPKRQVGQRSTRAPAPDSRRSHPRHLFFFQSREPRPHGHRHRRPTPGTPPAWVTASSAGPRTTQKKPRVSLPLGLVDRQVLGRRHRKRQVRRTSAQPSPRRGVDDDDRLVVRH